MGDPVQSLSKTVHPEVAGPKLQQNPPICNLIVESDDVPYAGHLTSNSYVHMNDASFVGDYAEESSSVLDTPNPPVTGAPYYGDPLYHLQASALTPDPACMAGVYR